MKTLNQHIKESLQSKAIYNESILDDEEDIISSASLQSLEISLVFDGRKQSSFISKFCNNLISLQYTS